MSAALPELVQWVLAEDPATSEPLPPSPPSPLPTTTPTPSSSPAQPVVTPPQETAVVAPEPAPVAESVAGQPWDPWAGLYMFNRDELDMHELMDPQMYGDESTADIDPALGVGL